MTETGPGGDRTDERARLIRKLKKIELVTMALVSGLQPGLHNSLFKGRGMEFAEIREYVAGDDVRSIDWKVTARYNHPFIREYAEERDQTFYFLVDVSGSGTFGSRETKREKMLEVTASLAFAALNNNDRIGLCLFSDRVEDFRPAGRGRKYLISLLNTMIGNVPVSRKTDIAGAARFLGKVLPRRSSVIILSDFAAPEFLPELRVLARRHEVIAIRVTDKREQELPDAGLITLEDPETGEQILADTSDPAFRNRYAALAAGETEALTSGFSRAGIGNLLLQTTDSCYIPLNSFFRGRRRNHGRVL